MARINRMRCDVCGAEYQYNDNHLLVETTRAVVKFPTLGYIDKSEYDLCPNCKSKLLGLLEDKEQSETKTCETCANWDRRVTCKIYTRRDNKAEVWNSEDYCSRWEEREALERGKA